MTGSVETSDWYLHPTQPSTSESDVISSTGTEGWETNRATSDDGRVVRLMRVSDSAKEGIFTCHIPGCNNVSVGVYYPSECMTGVCVCTTEALIYVQVLTLYKLLDESVHRCTSKCKLKCRNN